MSALSQLYSDRPRGGGLRRRRLSVQRQTLAALAVSVVAGMAIFATTAGSLMEGAMAAPPAVKSPPPGWIDLAFADVDAASARSAIHARQMQPSPPQGVPAQETRKQDSRKPDPCADFVYFFLNTNCSAKRVSAVHRDGSVHRVVAARTAPTIVGQDTGHHPERLTAATTTTATD